MLASFGDWDWGTDFTPGGSAPPTTSNTSDPGYVSGSDLLGGDGGTSTYGTYQPGGTTNPSDTWSGVGIPAAGQMTWVDSMDDNGNRVSEDGNWMLASDGMTVTRA